MNNLNRAFKTDLPFFPANGILNVFGFAVFSIGLFCAPNLFGAVTSGLISQIEGQVQIFVGKSATVDGPSPRVMFESAFYTLKEAKLGDRVLGDQIIRTAPGAKAKLVFPNGDSISLGSGTAMRLQDVALKASENAKKDGTGGSGGAPSLNLDYGKIRAIIEKRDPKKRLKISTPSATLGVRGTDFFLVDRGKQGGTELSVVRGSVELAQQQAKGAKKTEVKPVIVNKGITATIVAPAVTHEVAGSATGTGGKSGDKASGKDDQSTLVAASGPVLKPTSKQELEAINQVATIKPSTAAVPEEVKKQLEVAEAASLKILKQDIKRDDPALYKKIENEKTLSFADINKNVVETLKVKAPDRPKNEKPSMTELEEISEEAQRKIEGK